MKKYSEYIYKIVNLKLLIISTIIFLFFLFFILPSEAEKSYNITGIKESPDTNLFYSTDYLYEISEKYGEKGRQYYIRSRYTFDIAWPLSYFFFLTIFMTYIIKNLNINNKLKYLNLSPLLGTIFDFLENSSVSIIMYRFPLETKIIDFLAPIFTLSKWIFIFISFAVIIILLFYYVLKKLKINIITSIIIILIIIMFSVIMFVNIEEKVVILIVTKSQTDTTSLNPTRIEVASNLALEDYNKNDPKINIEHILITYEGNEINGYNLAKKYIENNKNISFIVGDFNSPGTNYLSKLSEEYNIPHISFFATDENIFINNKNSFSYRSTLQQEHQIMIKILEEVTNSKNLVIISSSQRNLLQRNEEFNDILKSKTNFSILKNILIDSNTNDFNREINFLKENKNNYDSIILFLRSNQIEHFLQQFSLNQINKSIIINGVSISVEGVEELISINLDMFSFVPEIYLKLYDENEKDLQNFAERYRIAIGYHRFDSLGPWIYDGFLFICDIICEYDKNKNNILDIISSYNEERMVGRVSFDEFGLFNESTFKIVKIENGTFIEVDIND